VLYRDYPEQECSLARALEVIGERWSLLIVRDVFAGIRRYEDLHRSLDIARNILQTRLNRLCDEEVLERRRYAAKRYEYYLTKKGLALWAPMMALLRWGDSYYAEAGPPRVFKHRGCGGRMDARLTCGKCGEALGPTRIYMEWGPGSSAETRKVRDALEASAMRVA
jgi:DNA-binding HxlR family transcriptional regulator